MHTACLMTLLHQFRGQSFACDLISEGKRYHVLIAYLQERSWLRYTDLWDQTPWNMRCVWVNLANEAAKTTIY